MKRLICLLAIAVILCIPVSAEDKIPSPTTTLFSVQFYDGNYNPISYIINDGETFSHNIDLTRGSWQGWTFYNTDGTLAIADTDFVWIKGSENSANIEIKPLTDLFVCANYDEMIIPVQRAKSKSLLKSSPNNTDDDSTEDNEEKDVDIGYKTQRRISIVFLYILGVLFGMLISHLLMCWVVDRND